MQDRKRKEYSIKDIAREAKAGVSTVSRVLNNSGYVAPQTKKRILEVIEHFNYTPSMIARGLRGSRLPVIGVLIPDITGEFYNSLVLHLQQALYRRNYLMMIVNTNKRRNAAPIYEGIGNSLNLSGWIFCGSDERNADQGVPTVYINPIPTEIAGDHECSVESDSEMGGWLAVRELLEGGCKRIAFMAESRYPLHQNKRFMGYCRALKEAGLPVDEKLVVITEWVDYENGYTHTRDLLARAGDVDGLFCTADRYIPGALTALAQMGKSVPRDVQVVGFDDMPISKWSGGGCTTVRQHIDQIAEAAAGSLLQIIGGEELDSYRKRIPVELVRRATTLGR